jgi:hypothetical protein
MLAATLLAPLLAQLVRAPGFEPGGWGFKSLGAGQHRERQSTRMVPLMPIIL